MQLTVSYQYENEDGTETFESVQRYDAPEFDYSTVELEDNTYVEYENTVIQSVKGSNLTLLVQHYNGESTRYESVTKVTNTTESICIRTDTESDPVYLASTDTILWITT